MINNGICSCGHRHRGIPECKFCDCVLMGPLKLVEDNMFKRIWKKIKSWFWVKDQWEAVMDYRFTAILIVLLCLLALFVRPVDNHTPLKIDSKNFILPKPKPKIDE